MRDLRDIKDSICLNTHIHKKHTCMDIQTTVVQAEMRLQFKHDRCAQPVLCQYTLSLIPQGEALIQFPNPCPGFIAAYYLISSSYQKILVSKKMSSVSRVSWWCAWQRGHGESNIIKQRHNKTHSRLIFQVNLCYSWRLLPYKNVLSCITVNDF